MEWQSPQEDLSDHVVICNCSEKVRRIVEELHLETVENRPDVVLVVQEEQLWRDNPTWHPDDTNEFSRDHFFVQACDCGDPLMERIRRVNITAARAAVILADPRHGKMADARSTLVAVSIEREAPQVHSVMELIASVNRAHLQATDVNEVVCQGEIAEKLITQSCITPGVKNIFQSLLTNAPGTNNIYISTVPESIAGMSYRDFARRLIVTSAPMILCGFLRPKADERFSEPPSRLSVAPSLPTSVSAASANAWSSLDFVINPRAGVEPGRDSLLEIDDQLVIIACRPPRLDEYVSGPMARDEEC